MMANFEMYCFGLHYFAFVGLPKDVLIRHDIQNTMEEVPVISPLFNNLDVLYEINLL